MIESTIIKKKFKVAAKNGEPMLFASQDEALHFRDTYASDILPMTACVAKLRDDQHLLILEFVG